MNANQVTKESVSKMDLANANSALTVKGITALQRQLIQTRITKLSTPEVVASEVVASLEGAQPEDTTKEGTQPEGTSSEDTSSKGEPVVLVLNTTKNKPGETTRTIEKFEDDTKGLRIGSQVTFLENNKPGAKVMQGVIQRIFDFYGTRNNRQEAKIKGAGGERIYRFEKDLTPVVAITTAPDPVTTPELAPELVEGLGI